ncbi:hypothetical protein K466DRAFT_601885 [Polyporus arcularius HHB13444]|uniref:Uncharacterized protein n=1 Tax=Polyporus arcularius HHB13444 TaxID=1314778 RepID=A0A5C3P5S7_9APHY|nr:hypothetical protein K466DRAFT_601885 [Polyporus arcularius HHB13444]
MRAPSPQDARGLLEHIQFCSALPDVVHFLPTPQVESPHMSQDSCDLMFESRALQAFRTYLLGSGHPDDPDIRAMLGRDLFARDVGDRMLRPRLFIGCLCGTDSVPDEQNWPKRIQVSFLHKGHRPLGDAIDVSIMLPPPSPLDVHADFCSCTIIIDDAMRNLLREGYPYMGFQVWMHATIVQWDTWYDRGD